MSRRVLVYGPAYLDRVLRVDRPLLEPGPGQTLDRSIEARLGTGASSSLLLTDPAGGSLTIEPPPDWPGPWGTIPLLKPLDPMADRSWNRHVVGLAWHDDLGGMGAGYAKAFGGRLISALGSENDPISQAVADLLVSQRIAHRPIRVSHPADWTLLITSGSHGDKLPLGFRGCHAALDAFPETEPSGLAPELVVVASLTNRLARSALRSFSGSIRMFAPALRNMTDRDPPLGELADLVEILCGNREEWSALPASDRARFDARLSLQAITDGPRGAVVRFRTPSGTWDEVSVPAFPRRSPPRDTNRAGEAFASTLVTTLLDSGWRPGPTDPALVRRAALRASAAAAIELDLVRFAFPGADAIEEALRRGEARRGESR